MPNDIANVNTAMGFTQAATLMNSIVSQATGKTSITATRLEGFISQAQTALRTGFDPLMNAISQTLSKTLFSVRPYNAKFLGLQRDSVQWGNHVRKINFSSEDVENIDKYDLTNGESVDMQKYKKPNVLQTNFYSVDTYQDHYSIPDDQVKLALSGPDELMRFVSGITTEVTNKLEQFRENFSRATLINLIAATANKGRVRHLLTEYATLMGIVDTNQDPDTSEILTTYIDGFTKWLFAELKVLSERFTYRSLEYHTNIDDHPLYRHTPKELQRLYIYSPFLAQVDARVLSAVFNPGYLNLGQREEVAYWQSIKTPDTINVIPSQIYGNGTYSDGDAFNKPVLGILMDWEAAGVTQKSQYMAPAPHNVRGRYTTFWYSIEMRGWNDMTENAVALVLD